MFFLYGAPEPFRTQAAADEIYTYGMRYLRYHVLLCKLSMRPGYQLNLLCRLCGMLQRLLCLGFVRQLKLWWQVRPKIHAPCLFGK